MLDVEKNKLWEEIAVSLATGTFHYTGDLAVDAERARVAEAIACGFFRLHYLTGGSASLGAEA